MSFVSSFITARHRTSYTTRFVYKYESPGRSFFNQHLLLGI